MEETKLHSVQENLKTYENNLKELQNLELSTGTKNQEIDQKIQ